ncbi:MAG: YtxH domain-containing protein [Candidatus Pseudobacter hemicellulosilyticus]|uniref:YtxH domain-containing protein n=1 Tax=Candidatus Pseudobacter hemicellulosilyticus TaxID=3121375 RepID=A0AAJ6BFW3_9BACT|nr:MAG: YtxH domain-containing protein [Pseudobacter sp.]
MTTSTKVLLGILGAAAAGAAVGLLLAPEKGSELRKRIKDTANDWACQLSDMVQAGKAKAEDLAEEAGTRVSNMRENLG